MTASLAQEGPKDKLDMSSRQPVGPEMVSRRPLCAKKVPRIDEDMASRQPVWARDGWAKKAPRID